MHRLPEACLPIPKHYFVALQAKVLTCGLALGTRQQ